MTTEPVKVSLSLFSARNNSTDTALNHSFSTSQLSDYHTEITAGEHFYIHLLDIPLDSPLPFQSPVYYDLQFNGLNWTHWADDLVYDGHDYPFFILQPKVAQILHGSCRKPHHKSNDGLLRVDQLLAESTPETWPSLLMMSGDQIYADDVAAPMLWVIHQLIGHLKTENEILPCIEAEDTEALHVSSPYYFARDSLLPKNDHNQNVVEQFFGGVRKPIFTTDTAQNHLISVAEVLAMYALVWSPEGWNKVFSKIDWSTPENLTEEQTVKFNEQTSILKHFSAGLPKVRRAMAHLPVAMIFDDHDVTDDWNLTASWEQAAYENAFSSRIIGNALLGYLLCQGWGNAPENFPPNLLEHIQKALDKPGKQSHVDLIESLFRFSNWHYTWHTVPPLVVLDTRTHRWRSEQSLDKPSGLMDWEALTDLQHQLKGLDAVILVSPAPMFGVKLIEAIQKVFTWFGKPLMVDAENWMAHPGSAYALMNLFRHKQTPQNFVILSGDVHYSFVYDIQLRGTQRGPDVWQITSSGIRNEFPARLLDTFDRLNRWLYAPKSPLNWFTRRRSMKVIPHKPENASHGERLLNSAGISLVSLNEQGAPESVVQLCSHGENVRFVLSEEDARWE
ncbi:alkaline phosphatase D family protein [Marinomonas algarum]|uniref:Alkaline phosphatase family protein n=1 Tax=Marinomonas algarum TaxID=2883105 RepID=A0A9X1IMZ3_9GAMM|nr:alkaline phosphatase D family protein [Marinomonas algarum]MCB5161912.1 alkaline phosphatase family protein [Marinomonas algarum]